MSGKIISQNLANAYGLPETLTKQMLMDMLLLIENMAINQGRCQIRGFGTFRIKKSAQRTVLDYKSKSIMSVPEKNKLIFIHARDRKKLLKEVSHLSTEPLDKP